MGKQSRIKFNPVTKEIEIEGSENFVKTYFNKIQSMFPGTQEAAAGVPIKEIPVEEEKAPEEKLVKERHIKTVRQSKKASVAAEPIIELPAKKVRQSKRVPKVIKGIKKGDMTKVVLALILDSPEGITSAELKEKTGLKDRQIWAITSLARKKGKIKQANRGGHVGV